MNKQCYRVVFNKARGMLMVVSEAARSQGKTSNPAAGGSEVGQVAANSQTSHSQGSYQGGKLGTLRSSVLLSLGLATIVGMSSNAIADSTKIVADRNAAATNQATIIKSSNGTTQVNIQSPSSAGVSRNVFSQFDVDRDGAILNNSRTNTNTKIAGWVEGNPYLARGEARVILNEVNSSDPSRLSGFTEIAGGKAELVIANPAGITCSGCGFVNASRTTLTTGQAMMEQGKLTGFDVTGGKIRVDGKGMSMGGSDYSQIIAKAVALNAGVEAKSLDVITGSNVVSYAEDPEQSQITAKDAAAKANNKASNKTGVALDVSSLGGMYAGKIRLIGTDKGMGVSNAGSITATSGNLQLDVQGNLVNTGDMVANKGKVAINTHDQGIDNAGTISSSRDTLDLTSRTLKNSGVISSHDVATLAQANSINNSGDIVAGSFKVSADDLSNTGKLLQAGQGQLAIKADTLTNTKNAIIGQDLYPDAATDPSKKPVVTPSQPPSSANNGSKVEASTNNQDTPEKPAPLPAITQDGSITVKHLSNTGDKAAIYANSSIAIQADQVTNTEKASLAVKDLVISEGGRVNNTDSRIQSDKIDWQLAELNNTKGQIVANQSMTVSSKRDIDNTQGNLAAIGDITLTTNGDIENRKGTIQANGAITTQATVLDNSQGMISGQGNITLDNKGVLTNSQGRIQSDQTLKIKGQGYDNTDGSILGVKRVDIDVIDDISISSANNDIQAGQLTLISQGRFINTSKLTGQKGLTVSAQSINNQKGAELSSQDNTTLNAEADIDNRGLINGNNTYLNAKDTVSNYSNGRIYGDHVAIEANTLNNTPDVYSKTKVDKCEPGPGCEMRIYDVNSNEQIWISKVYLKDLAMLEKSNPDKYHQEMADYKFEYYKLDSDPAPVIAARNRLDIGVTALNNNPNFARAGIFNEDFNGQARLLSNGELHIGGSLDANHQATGRAATVTNKGASIESVGDMSIDTKALNNVNADWLVKKLEIDRENGVVEYAKEQGSTLYSSDRVQWSNTDKGLRAVITILPKNPDEEPIYLGEDWYKIIYDNVTLADEVQHSDPSRLVSGKNLVINGDDLINDKSQFNTGAGFKPIADGLKNNVESTNGGRYRLVDNGTIEFHTVESDSNLNPFDGFYDHEHKWHGKTPYTQGEVTLATYPLPILNQAIDKSVIAHDVTGSDSTNIDKTETDEIRSSGNTPTLPNSSLYGINPDSKADYLIETDPAFTDYRNWLSSDYMLQRLQLDPSITQKRLGDGYYEQQYIRDQIMMLTGRYYLGSYESNDAQYQGLMDAGITMAKTLNLRPGIALTAAQVAQLTTDIVWMEQQDFTLPDGTTQKVLVPKVYTRQARDQIDGTKSLIAANNIDAQLTGDLDNQGSIVGHNSVNIKALNLTNDQGLIAGNYVQVTTDKDLNNSGSLKADSAMSLNVGGNLNNKSATYTSDAVKGASNAT